MINPEKIPQIDGDADALVSHAAAVTRAGAEFANTGQQVNSTWQGLSAVYQAPESAQLLAATAPVQTVTASVGEDIQAVGTALNTYATEIREIKAQLAALRTQATEFLDSVNGDEDWREDEDKVNRHNGLLDAVNTQLAAYFDAERKCANAINALYCGTQYRPHNGDDKVDAGEHGLTADQLKTVKELPWGTAEKHDRNFIEDVGAFLSSFGETALNALVDMGALIGRDPATGDWSWGAAGNAWKGIGTFALAITAYSPVFGGAGAYLDQTFGLPGFERGAMGKLLFEAGKSLIAYDQWGEDNARAAGAATFNIISAVGGTKGAGAALRGTGTAMQGVRGGVVAARVSTTLIRTGQLLERIPTVGDLAGLAAKRFNIRIPIIGPILGIAGDIPQVTHHVDIEMPGSAHPSAGDMATRSSAINDRPYTSDSVEASFDGTSKEAISAAETPNISRFDEAIIPAGGRPGVSDVDGLERASGKAGREDRPDSPDFPGTVAIDRGLSATPVESRPIEHVAMEGLSETSLSPVDRIATGGQVGMPRVDSAVTDLVPLGKSSLLVKRRVCTR